MAVLAGDIGGTKTLLQLSEPKNGGFDVLYEKRYASADYQKFLSLVQDFMAESYAKTGIKPVAACFGIAGPVSGRTAVTTNLPWKLDADELESILDIRCVRLINDFQAVGYGIEVLKNEDIVTLQDGVEVPNTTRVIIGAGTGLGQAFLVWRDDHYEVMPSEGGHADFAPRDEVQIALLQYLIKRYGWPTWERVVSGRGLVNIFNFFVESQHEVPSESLVSTMKTEDHAAAISHFGMTGADPVAEKSIHLFTQLYGAQAGNLGLLGMGTGGIYVAGGVAPKMIDKLKDGTFMRAFLDKDDRMLPLLSAMPVKVVINANVGLMGSAVAAARLA